jgi:hypothetical protein
MEPRYGTLCEVQSAKQMRRRNNEENLGDLLVGLELECPEFDGSLGAGK